MLKKRLILFLLLLPIVGAYECITYEDCPESQCIGSIRTCSDGICTKSTCLSSQNATLREESTGTSYQKIVGISVKFIMLTLGTLTIALLFPVLNLHGKAKAVAVIGFFVLVIVFGVYVFVRPGFTNSEDWTSAESDSRVIGLLNYKQADVDEIIIDGTDGISGGKEYRIMERIHETSVTVLTVKRAIGLKSMTSTEVIQGEPVRVSKTGLYSTYTWTEDDLQFIIVGEPKQARSVSEDLILGVERYNKPLLPGLSPSIQIVHPQSEAVTNNNTLLFNIHDNDSSLNFSSLSIRGIDWDMSDCRISETLNCSISGQFEIGTNFIDISIRDIEGHKSKTSQDFVFDIEPWVFLPIFPQDTDYINKPRIEFIITDSNGLEFDSFEIVGAPVNTGTCDKTATEMHCKFDNLRIPEGAYNVKIQGRDKAGNRNTAELGFVYDGTRPEIEILDGGFIIKDNILLKKDSLMIDRKRYSIDNCIIQDEEYVCHYTNPYKSVSITDEAGNNVEIQIKKERTT